MTMTMRSRGRGRGRGRMEVRDFEGRVMQRAMMNSDNASSSSLMSSVVVFIEQPWPEVLNQMGMYW
jgi:hypothetical protein